MAHCLRAIALCALLAPAPAPAQTDPPPSTSVPRRRWIELTPVPIIGGDSDVGLGGGALVSIARISNIRRPYFWRVEAFAMTTLRSIDGELTVPYQDYYVLLVMPHVVRDRLEIQARIAFTKMNLRYYGVGNDSPLPDDPEDSYFRYERTHPTVSARALYRLTRRLDLEIGLAYTHNWLDVPRPSKLRDDAAMGSSTVREMIGIDDFRDHGVLTNSYGIWFDTRDDQVSPRLGQLHTFRINVSPGGGAALPFTWIRTELVARFYVPLWSSVILGTRLVLDALSGDSPFYELARYDETFAIGGSKGLRGVPSQRYHGELKIFGNVEARFPIVDFELLNKTNQLGGAVFFDAGRLWATYGSNPDLDGSGLGLKLGMGAGLRLNAGSSFVIRADLGWSPDARPIAAYFVAGHMF